MDQKPEVIRQQMEDTRASLTNKIEALETKVVGTVHDATAAVTNTVTSVKQAVQDTVQTVKGTVRDTFDVAHHVRAHPWAMFGASVAAGFVGGVLLGPRSSRRSGYGARHPDDWGRGPARFGGELRATGNGYSDGNGRHNGFQAEAQPAAKDQEHGLLHSVTEQFGPELAKLKGVAIGTLFGFAREMLSRSVPEQLSNQLSQVVDDVTRKMGGEPVRGPLLADDRTTRTAASYTG